MEKVKISKRPSRRMKFIASSLLASSILTGCGGETSGANEQNHDINASVALKVGKTTLDGNNLCQWTSSNPEPLVKRDPPTVQVDGRCNFPMPSNHPEDPANHIQVGINRLPIAGNDKIMQASNGTELRVKCVVLGQRPEQVVTDANGNQSAAWLNVKTEQSSGYISEVNAGWTADMLLDNDLVERCPFNTNAG